MDVREAEPLARYQAMRTRDADEAEQVVSRAYVPHHLRTWGPVDARLNLATSSRLAFGYLTYGGEVELRVPPMISCYHLNLTVRGKTSVRHGRANTTTTGARSGVLLSPQNESVLTWSPDATQFAVKIPVASLRAQLSCLLHEPAEAPSCELHLDLTAAAGTGLLSAATFLAHQLDTGGTSDLVREQLESYLLTQLLLAAEHSYSARLRNSTTGPVGRVQLDEALDYIECHPERALGIAELAAAVGTTAAALQATFEKELGVRPEAYVRDVRLNRAHAQLREGRPGDSVESVARRWGFVDIARFRAEYSTRYGGYPGRPAPG
ncbi:AraC family transcriptional regulator [Pseudonocardia acidicola]|uniref:AraC family transcriptional regulator n=1 Tax=Pseudonocardia acidicola TaxID=2724939 RepID=A0ABX1S697_9PSEU|nr:AraC family transcriptional regulator [Pseudonocardia acidicola]NMH96630.1 AraC family transcriptional regulator [Pseudonocardia acidicola]